MNILAIDDERDTLLFLKDLLTQAGHRVTAVDNGVRAMAAVQIEPVDVVLLDLMMPGTDGYKVARFLSENWKTYEIPVVVLSCCRDDESKSLAVRRPGGNIDGALSAEEPCQHGDFAFASHRHETQHDVFVGRMAGHVLRVSEKDHPLAVG